MIGGFIVGIMYILLRSIEKALAKGWSFGVKRIEGDWEHKRVEVEMDPTPPHPDEKPAETAEDLKENKESGSPV